MPTIKVYGDGTAHMNPSPEGMRLNIPGTSVYRFLGVVDLRGGMTRLDEWAIRRAPGADRLESTAAH